jgi:hypothetical protein
VALHLPVAPPFWKVLLGAQVTFADLADLDTAEHTSLRALLGAPLEEGTLFEAFELSFGGGGGGGGGGAGRGEGDAGSGGAGGGGGVVRLVPAGPYLKVGARAGWGRVAAGAARCMSFLGRALTRCCGLCSRLRLFLRNSRSTNGRHSDAHAQAKAHART